MVAANVSGYAALTVLSTESGCGLLGPGAAHLQQPSRLRRDLGLPSDSIDLGRDLPTSTITAAMPDPEVGLSPPLSSWAGPRGLGACNANGLPAGPGLCGLKRHPLERASAPPPPGGAGTMARSQRALRPWAFTSCPRPATEGAHGSTGTGPHA